jgi:hypothetical protein
LTVLTADALARVGRAGEALAALDDARSLCWRASQIAVTMEIYAQASSKATRAALKRLGDSLHG